ncbi:NUDIX domain-containing protein [Pontibacter oryzae]|uniref:NUDIX hydrolase n=1 Tax=Pontibacter oryzae TaxID=2304593 RepID=A0A399SFK5_9BACT|nr:NUDIX hydrolase [Pontibacter oryzae]RIJ41794.1 NUDIX hydrolase [Pontibacter oryzae]
MPDLNPAASTFAHKLRVRVCGICIQDHNLLLVRHAKTLANDVFWAPPGGGLQYGESMQQCLIREFKEETGLDVEVSRFLFVNEFVYEPLHAIEFFFEVQVLNGELQKGTDPELDEQSQLIEEVAWMSMKEIQSIPIPDRHRVLQYLISLDDLMGMPHNFMP